VDVFSPLFDQLQEEIKVKQFAKEWMDSREDLLSATHKSELVPQSGENLSFLGWGSSQLASDSWQLASDS